MRLIDVPSRWRSSFRIVADVDSADITRFLTSSERTDLERLRVPERRMERAASRIAGKILAQELYGIDNALDVTFARKEDRPMATIRGTVAPFSVSFTHSHGLGAAATGSTPVGVDLERFRAIRREMTRFFLSPDELSVAARLDIDHPLLHFWSAKEAAFKLSEDFPTLLKVPLTLIDSSSSGLTFRIGGTASIVETHVIGASFIASLARTPVSAGET